MFGGFVYRSIANKTSTNYVNLNEYPEVNSYSSDTYGTSITALDLSNLDIFSSASSNARGASAGINFAYIFANCLRLTEVELPAAPSIYVNEGGLPSINFNNAFENCIFLKSFPDFSNYQISSCSSMFWNCTGLTEIDLTKFEIASPVPNLYENMFLGCNNLVKVVTNES